MKRQFLAFAKSKSTLFFLLVAAGLSIGITSCSKDEDAPKSEVSNENAAVMVTQSVTAQGGFVEQVNRATLAISSLEARKAEGGRLADFCGKSEKDSIKLSGNGNNFGFDYALYWSYGLTCQQNTIPSQFAFDFSGRVALLTEQFSTSSNYASVYTLRGLNEGSANWEISQKYDATGKLDAKTTEFPSYSSEIHYESSDIKVSKRTRQIIAGTASVKISGKDSKGTAFSYQGIITFKGDNKATYIVNGGGSFELQW
ncbi:hypothetical protein [Chitinophaga rhizophila]|uniref:Lipoprotein n=1 Tax=Chitinophaga rhizophila TaxID=2866212 RepID=A0ABS7GA81_9BACT|nr:hypothetical protein [Chitinophaga rhizophila]MBW8684565.1 hypothetical protein [Chitinophaga rhizophila]